jgi:hypothetical protein
MAFKVKAKLNVSTRLKVDAHNDEWAHVTDVEENYTWLRTDGWIYTKHVEPCSDQEL